MAKKKETFKIGDTDETMHIAYLLDMSGSMMGARQPTISGFNEYKASLAAKYPDARLTFVCFSDIAYKEVCIDMPIKDVADLTEETYTPDGMTPLYDSIGRIVSDLSSRVTSGKVLLMIMTDGLENASKEYSRETIKLLIADKEKNGWTVGYMGANQDAWNVAASIGVHQSNSMNYDVSQMRGTFAKAAVASSLYMASAGNSNRNLFTGLNGIDSEDEPEVK